MPSKNDSNWDPKSEANLENPIAAYDQMRERCPVAYSELLGWSLFRHEDVLRVLHDPDTFSNAVSSYVSVPNGMDEPEHSAYRRIIDPYFSSERMNAFEPACREIAVNLVQDLLAMGEVELMADFALLYAIRAQCAFLGWPKSLHEPLIRWTKKNRAAIFAQDREALSEIAREFQGIIDDLLENRLHCGTKLENDVTAELAQEMVLGRPLSNEEIASILRNWTVGEVGTIAAAAGILTHYLAEHVELQQQLRTQPDLLPDAIDEILRIHGPLVANRRITKCPVEIGGHKIDAGQRISLIWIAANRDKRAFENPLEYRTDRDPEKNLLYGAGIHACPGATLARMEMQVLMEELLRQTSLISTIPNKLPSKAVYPESGFSYLPLRFQ